VFGVTTLVTSVLLEHIEINDLVSSSTDLNFFPGKHVQNVSRNDDINTFLDPIHLCFAFIETSFTQERSVLFNVILSDHLFTAFRAKFNFLLRTEKGSEILVDSSSEVSITKLLSILAEFLNLLPLISIKRFEVIKL